MEIELTERDCATIRIALKHLIKNKTEEKYYKDYLNNLLHLFEEQKKAVVKINLRNEETEDNPYCKSSKVEWGC